jgi:hypothetical protein
MAVINLSTSLCNLDKPKELKVAESLKEKRAQIEGGM